MKKWNPDPVEKTEDGSWIFWDETWAYSHGPFETEEIAREQLKVYAKSLDTPNKGDLE